MKTLKKTKCKPNLLFKAYVVYSILAYWLFGKPQSMFSRVVVYRDLAYLPLGKPQCMFFASCGLLLKCVYIHNLIDPALIVNLKAQIT